MHLTPSGDFVAPPTMGQAGGTIRCSWGSAAGLYPVAAEEGVKHPSLSRSASNIHSHKGEMPALYRWANPTAATSHLLQGLSLGAQGSTLLIALLC